MIYCLFFTLFMLTYCDIKSNYDEKNTNDKDTDNTNNNNNENGIDYNVEIYYVDDSYNMLDNKYNHSEDVVNNDNSVSDKGKDDSKHNKHENGNGNSIKFDNLIIEIKILIVMITV